MRVRKRKVEAVREVSECQRFVAVNALHIKDGEYFTGCVVSLHFRVEMCAQKRDS